MDWADMNGVNDAVDWIWFQRGLSAIFSPPLSLSLHDAVWMIWMVSPQLHLQTLRKHETIHSEFKNLQFFYEY